MEWRLDKSRPVCPQMCERLCVEIAVGELMPNNRIPSVREIAVDAGVNPNTVQKALEQLEGMGLLYSIRGTGWFVAEDTSIANDTLKRLLDEKTSEYFSAMSKLGLSSEQIKDYIKEWKI